MRGRQIVEAGDDLLRAVHTPGHAPDHLCFWHEESRTLFSGDLAVKGTTVYIPPNLQGDLADYLASLERVRALQPARLLPAHGPVIDDPDDRAASDTSSIGASARSRSSPRFARETRHLTRSCR